MVQIIKTDISCECGEYKLKITSGFVGYMGSKPCYSDTGECVKCGNIIHDNEINKRFNLK